MKVALFSSKPYDREYFDRANHHAVHHISYYETALNADTAELAKGYDVVCVFVNDLLNRITLSKLAALGVRVVVLRCAGFNHVDLQAAQELNIRIFRVPAYSPQAVAEHSVALILTLNRKTHKAYNRVRESNFSLDKLTGFNLFGKTVGVIGTGQIGTAFCKIMLGFGCKVLATDFTESEELKHSGVTYTTFDELISSSDIISLYCPLTPQTHYMMNAAAFAKMKQGVMLINCSRGAVIHTRDAIDALKTGKLGYLGIDVYEQEEHVFFYDHSESIIQDELLMRLMTFPNVLITAHQGFFTHEALTQIATVTLKNISDAASHLPSLNEVKYK